MQRIIEAFTRPRWQVTAVDELLMNLAVVVLVLLVSALIWIVPYAVRLVNTRRLEAELERQKAEKAAAERKYYESELATARERYARSKWGLGGEAGLRNQIAMLERKLK